MNPVKLFICNSSTTTLLCILLYILLVSYHLSITCSRMLVLTADYQHQVSSILEDENSYSNSIEAARHSASSRTSKCSSV